MKMIDFPEFRQSFEYDCGAMAMLSVLAHYGIDASENKIMKIAKTRSWRGTPVMGFERVAKKFRLKCEVKEMEISDIKRHIDKNIPVILRLQAWSRSRQKWEKCWTSGHYAVAIGYDKNKIYFEDPYSIFRTFLTFKELEKRWHDKDWINRQVYHNLGIVITGKKVARKKIIHMG